MVLLLDINIILDYLLKREEFYYNAKRIIEKCSDENINGCIALHTITTLWYLLRKVPDDRRRFALKSICELLQIVGTTHDEVVKALDTPEFKDFEDCIQTKCAKTAKADYIITRNKQDFSESEIPVLTPQEWLELQK